MSLLFLAALLFAPLITVFATALEKGFELYFESFADSDTLAAIRLTLTTAAIVVPINTVFGIAAAWAIAKFEFSGKSVLITLIDLPIAVSPVISGLIYVLLFGMQGWFGLWLQEHDISIIFALPGIVLATMFVTFPYVARELIPLMQQLGNDEEEAAITLGAGGIMTFFHVTLPKIRWGLVYGVILCNARAMGEFGAVSVVSGHIRGLTTTMPLHVEILYQRIQLRGRLRGRVAPDAARRGDADHQDAGGVAHGIPEDTERSCELHRARHRDFASSSDSQELIDRLQLDTSRASLGVWIAVDQRARSCVLVVGGISISAIGSLRDLADQQGKSRVQLAGAHGARRPAALRRRCADAGEERRRAPDAAAPDRRSAVRRRSGRTCAAPAIPKRSRPAPCSKAARWSRRRVSICRGQRSPIRAARAGRALPGRAAGLALRRARCVGADRRRDRAPRLRRAPAG